MAGTRFNQELFDILKEQIRIYKLSTIIKSVAMREILNDDFLLQFKLHYFDSGMVAIGCQGFRRKETDKNKNQRIGMIEHPLIMINNHPVMMIRGKEYIGSGGRDIWESVIRDAFNIILDDIGIDTNNSWSCTPISPIKIPYPGDCPPEYSDTRDWTFELIQFKEEADRLAFLMFGKDRCIDYNDTFTMPETLLNGEKICK